MTPYELAVSAMRSKPVTAVARRLTKRKLRILAYHGVPDAERFASQMEYLAANYTPVDEQVVVAAMLHNAELPEGAAWVTFDDGDPTVVTNGLPALSKFNVPATMFVCPGLIESGAPFWWNVTEWMSANEPSGARALSGGADLTEHAKTVSDADRRTLVAEVLASVPEPHPVAWRQLSSDQLTTWTEAGMDLGNHSWDHPCLDQCTTDVQGHQIRQTHDWLTERLGRAPRTFAYPNGNFSDVVDSLVDELGYELAVLYDNALAPVPSPPLRLSRLMLEADQPAQRLTGVLSGAQPALAKAGLRLRLAVARSTSRSR